MANKTKPDMIPLICAIFLKNKGSIVEKRHLLILFSVCYLSLQKLDFFFPSFIQVLKDTMINALPF